MSDSKKIIDLEINSRGNAGFNLKEMKREVKEVDEAVEKLGRSFDAAGVARQRLEREGQAAAVQGEYDRLTGGARGPTPFEPAALARKLIEREGQAAAVQEHYERLKGAPAAFDYSAAARRQVENETHRAKIKAHYENLTEGPAKVTEASNAQALAKGAAGAGEGETGLAQALAKGAAGAGEGETGLALTTALTVVAVAVKGLTTAIETSTGIARALNDEMLPGAGQKALAVMDAIPLGGAAMRRTLALREETQRTRLGLSDRTIAEELRFNERENQVQLVKKTAETQAQRQYQAAKHESDTANERAAALAGRAPPERLAATGRETYAEQIEYEQSAVRMPAKDQQRKAAADLGAAAAGNTRAAKGETEAGERLHRGQAELKEIQAKGDKIDKSEKWDESVKEQRIANLQQQEQKLADIKRHQALFDEASNRAKGTSIALAQAESGVRKANIALAQADLQVLEQGIQRKASAAAGFGRMLPTQRAAAAQAVEAFAERGIEGISLWQREQVRHVAPGAIAKAEEASGDAFRREHLSEKAQKAIGVDRGALADDRRQEAEQAFQVKAAFEIDETKLAKALGTELKRYSDVILRKMKERIEDEAARLRIEFKKRNAAG